MSERAYTVAEVDRMRQAVEYKWLFGRKTSESGLSLLSKALARAIRTRGHKEEEKTRCVEELLRTHMLAGVQPEELE